MDVIIIRIILDKNGNERNIRVDVRFWFGLCNLMKTRIFFGDAVFIFLDFIGIADRTHNMFDITSTVLVNETNKNSVWIYSSE